MLWLILLMCAAPQASAQVSREYDLKAVFLYNLASFVNWPKFAFPAPDAPFVIGVLGDDPFGRVLDDVVANEFVGTHPFRVHRFRRIDDVENCQLLFISESESRHVESILRRLRGKPVLTVADLQGFAEAGGMVGLRTEHEQLQLYVNPAAAEAATLSLSSKLLEVAHVVADSFVASP